MERPSLMKRLVRQFFPYPGRVYFTGFYCLCHELGALIEDTARAERVMADLGIPHVIVARQADGGPVRLERQIRALRHEPVQHRCPCQMERVTLVLSADADPVHDNKQEGSLTFYFSISLKGLH